MSRFKPYPAYKSSGVEWLGEVPKHWILHKLKYIARFSGGGTPNRENLAYWNGDIPWVSPKDMKVEVIASAEENITAEGLQNSTTSLVSPGGVLIVVRSGILKHTIPVAINNVEVALNQDMKALRFDPKSALCDFFFRWVQGLNNQLLHAWLKQGATVESIEQEYLADTTVPIPGIIEQRMIVDFLNHETARIDTLIEEQQHLIELLKEKRRAVISHAVTKGLDPTVPMKDSGVEWLGEVPAHWRNRRVKRLFRQNKRQGYTDMEVLSVYRDYGVIKKSSREDNNNKTPEDLSLYQLVMAGDLVVNKMKAWQGSLGVSEHLGITSPDYVVYSPSHDEVPKFIHYLLRASHMPGVYLSISNGIRPSQWRIEPERFEQVEVFLPDKAEQFEIVSYLEAQTREINELILCCEQASEFFSERRSALISAAVTGKIDVRGWQPPASVSFAVLEEEAV